MLYPIYKVFKYILDYPINKIKKYFSYKENLQYLCSIIEPSTIKKADGEIREIQNRYLNFAIEVNQIMENINLKPFLVSGTLLGAIRHGGYIPWDDDLDFGLIRDEYENLISWAKENAVFEERKSNRFWSTNQRLKYEDNLIKKNPNKLIFIHSSEMLQIYTGTSLKNFSLIDIFPFDFYKDGYSFEEHKKYLRKIHRKLEIINNYSKEITFLKEERKNNPNIGSGTNIGYSLYKIFYKYDDIFPLKKIKFEDTEFYAPNNSIVFLENIFGKNWNKLPLDVGYSHHRVLINKYNRKYNR